MAQTASSTTLDAPPPFAQGAVDVTFDTAEAAEYIGCTAGHLKNLRGVGGGPKFTRLFRRKGIQYSRSDIDRWKEERRFGSTTEYPEHFR